MVVNFVCTVDVDREFIDLCSVKHLNAPRTQTLGRSHRARDYAFDFVFHSRQSVDEFIHSRTSAHTHNLAAHHILQGGLPHQGL